MPDISMCMNSECPSNVECFRYRVQPHEYRQAYSKFEHDGSKCDSFYPISLNSGYKIREMSEIRIWR